MEPLPEPQKSRSWAGVGAALLAIVLIAVIAFFALPNLLSLTSFITQGNSTSTYQLTNVSLTSGSTVNGSSIEITYPQNYDTLANYALSLINNNRTAFGLSNVTLSPIPSGQQHADSMLQYGYFSHWDTQGYKPYMRYSLLGGMGFVEENVAYEYTNLPSFVTTQSVEKAINYLQWQMMYNDSVCCNNGHRDNILSPFHNRVSIGIVFDSTHVYFVEDFENYYINLTTPVETQSGNVVLDGNTSQTLTPTSVVIFYDSTPQPISAQTLNTVYDGPYTPGTFIGGVVPPCNNPFGCPQFSSGITVKATTWTVTTTSIDIHFSLGQFLQHSGKGVYTVTLMQGDQNNPEYLTSISIFVSS
ncbi:MAG: CAP domain-containing protein [Nitrososphaerota archaeon]|nr:CAP domain-containing protein [Nitrososphaerota archaeon]